MVLFVMFGATAVTNIPVTEQELLVAAAVANILLVVEALPIRLLLIVFVPAVTLMPNKLTPTLVPVPPVAVIAPIVLLEIFTLPVASDLIPLTEPFGPLALIVTAILPLPVAAPIVLPVMVVLIPLAKMAEKAPWSAVPELIVVKAILVIILFDMVLVFAQT